MIPRVDRSDRRIDAGGHRVDGHRGAHGLVLGIRAGRGQVRARGGAGLDGHCAGRGAPRPGLVPGRRDSAREALEQHDLIAGRGRSRITGVAHAISVTIGLRVIRDRRALVAGVAEVVAVLVVLVRIGDRDAVVVGVRNAVVVEIWIAERRIRGIGRRVHNRWPEARVEHARCGAHEARAAGDTALAGGAVIDDRIARHAGGQGGRVTPDEQRPEQPATWSHQASISIPPDAGHVNRQRPCRCTSASRPADPPGCEARRQRGLKRSIECCGSPSATAVGRSARRDRLGA